MDPQILFWAARVMVAPSPNLENGERTSLGAAVEFIWGNADLEVSMEHLVEMQSTNVLLVFLFFFQLLPVINNITMNSILINAFMQFLDNFLMSLT